MYCIHCGGQNDNSSKFCSSCGKELQPIKAGKSEPLHNSVIRRSIKKNAYEKNKGALYLGNIILIIAVIILVIVITVSFGTETMSESGSYHYQLDFTTNSFFNISLISIIFMAVITFFILGMNKVSLDISRDKSTMTRDIFKYPLQNIVCYLKVIGINILVYLILEVLMYIPFIGGLLYLILIIYLTPVLAILPYVVIDNDQMSIIEVIKRTFSLIKGKRVAYYALIFSFIGWYLLSIFTLGLLMIWVNPYVNVAMSNFYLHITNQKEYNEATKGISDGAVIGITIGTYMMLIIIFVLVIFTFAIFKEINNQITEEDNIQIEDNYYDYYDYYDNDNDIYGQTVSVSGLNIFVPNEYTEISLESYEKAYMSKEKDIVIGLITYDLSYDIAAKDYANFYKSAFSNNYSCGQTDTIELNHYNWEILECVGDLVNIKHYIAIQNRKLYLLTISYQHNSSNQSNIVSKNIEENLTFSNTVA